MMRRDTLNPWLAAAAFALGVLLLSAPAASAGPIWDWLCGNCPPPEHYSPARYWTPGLARINDYCHGPKISVYAPDRHPEIPPEYQVLSFPCPPVLPAATFIPVPTAPAESRFEYFERRDENINPTIPNGEAGKKAKTGKSKMDK